MGKDPTRSYRPTHRNYIGLDKTERYNPIKKSKSKGKGRITKLPRKDFDGPINVRSQKTKNTPIQVLKKEHIKV